MKKESAKKKTTLKKNETIAILKAAEVKPATKKTPDHCAECKRECFNPWSLSIYVYWFIILFFIASTFYILGRSHSTLHNSPVNNVEITEEALMQSNDYYESGKSKLLSGNIDDAIADLTAAINAGGATPNMYILRGEAYMQVANYNAAMDDFNSAVEQDENNAVALYDRSLLNTRMENYDAALNDINAAMAANASVPNKMLQERDLYAKRGQLNLWLKNWAGAVADFTNSLARPDGVVNPTVYADRAEAYTAMGEYQSAIEDYTSAVRVISEQIQGATTSAEREHLSSNAMNYFEKSAALNVKLGNMENALVDLQSAMTIANAMNDAESVTRQQNLIAQLQQTMAANAAPVQTPAVEPEAVNTVVEQPQPENM